jgi:NAD(P) transhydrogenase subunit alpha
VPGAEAPKLVDKDMVESMKPGSVIVDLAAENGGNCELTEAGEELLRHNVWVLGPLNVPATMPIHASQLYSKNIANLLALLVNKEAQFGPNYEDEVVAGTCITRDGEIVHPGVKSAVEANLQRSTA